jgi:hypothetical protein
MTSRKPWQQFVELLKTCRWRREYLQIAYDSIKRVYWLLSLSNSKLERNRYERPYRSLFLASWRRERLSMECIDISVQSSIEACQVLRYQAEVLLSARFVPGMFFGKPGRGRAGGKHLLPALEACPAGADAANDLRDHLSFFEQRYND